MVGDCNRDGRVVINELVLGVSIALNGSGIETCTAFDRDDDGAISISELVTGVNNALL